ncbi:MAG TPA: molybdopterin cofactor-binding domain-containing protein, partial [Acetobacteraceae bacterium]|nr:molybdopterin cofactor-binding domain-containing protein [Acetobacteraceae bacterium]
MTHVRPAHDVVGHRTPLIDGIEKVSGQARYTADLPAAGALVGRVLRIPFAHARIRAIDTQAARALPGVHAVITGADCEQTYGVLPIAMNEYPLARGRVRYRGEPVAAVAAVDDATAAAALRLIRLDVEELPAYFTATEARMPDAVLLHDDKPGNVERAVHHRFGDVEAGFAAADLVREQVFRCAEIAHAQMELNAALVA